MKPDDSATNSSSAVGRLARGFGFAAVAAAALAAAPATAQRGGGGPFESLAGSWSGNGTIRMASGASERIRCRAQYAVPDGGNSMQQDLRCASDSYRFDLRSDITSQGGAISGRFLETSRNVGGAISGRASPGTIQARAEGAGFSASLAVSTRGNQQSVTIQAPAAEVQEVSITMRKG
jgi:hypothetical protein